MAKERVQRRLAAILAADVVGYSRMMDADEAGTLARFKSLRLELFDPKAEQFGGRIFKNTGDGALAEFGSAVDAVQCAIEIQRGLARRNSKEPEDRRIVLRIGINLGDVIVEGDDIFGGGVNAAARLEGLCAGLEGTFVVVGLGALTHIEFPFFPAHLGGNGHMAKERVQRRLAAILAADVVGYSRMMDADEAGTLARFKSLRLELFDPKAEQFGGRIFKNTGDGALAEFGSAVDAVQCAIEIQRGLARRNSKEPEDRRIVLRIGINLGDVIVEGDDIFGGGVNAAASRTGSLDISCTLV